jgi:cholesterol oxidase
VTGDGAGLSYDVVVVGSGFGGSVTALRLAEKGYSVGVLEAGRRFSDATLPKTSWRLRRFLWMPRLGLRGMQRITHLPHVTVLSAAGVGGGSLNYANTLYPPLDACFDDPQWASITDWRDELAPYLDQARRMLGATENMTVTPHDRLLREVADEMGFGHTQHPTPVGVFLGTPGVRVPDPYFGGAGPDRTGCLECGECMTGCRYGAKNRLDANYLHLAERQAAVVHPECEVVDLQQLSDGSYELRTRRPGPSVRRGPVVRATQVVLCAGPLGSQRLLHRLKADGRLPRVSERLGELTRTNSQSLLSAEARRTEDDFTRGVAITSSVHPDPLTHVEPVRYGRGSNFMGLLFTPLTDGAPLDGSPSRPRWQTWLRHVARHPDELASALWRRRWSQRTTILVVMQALDNSITIRGRRTRWGFRLTSEQGHGRPNPDWIPVGNEMVRRLAEKMGGRARGGVGDVVGAPMTAHLIGGCVIGADENSGVVDPYLRLYGHEGLHVVDGSVVPANMGANPVLTITALAERAMALWPNKGEGDPRPPLGSAYRRLDPVLPQRPAVPAGAPGALLPTGSRSAAVG